MTSVKLYGYATSPYVRKVGCFLYYKGIEFEHVPVNPIDPAATIGHTKGRQVPVLEIDGEWRRESSELAYWLDELFPQKPLSPPDHKTKIDEIDSWISDSFLTSIFRPAIDGELNLQHRFRGWRLAAIVSAHTPLEMQMRIGLELMAHIGSGPYMGGLNEPTMLDLAVFPQLVWGYMFGLEENLSAARSPVIKAWMKRVSNHLPRNPTLVLDEMLVNPLSKGLA